MQTERTPMPSMKLNELMRKQTGDALKAIKTPETAASNKEKTLAAQTSAAERGGESTVAHASKESLSKMSAERAAQDAKKADEMKKDILKRFGGIRV